jgi:hypothetical protein
MSFPVQHTLFGYTLPIGDLERRIIAIYRENRRVADSDKVLAIEVWKTEGLRQAIEHGLESFTEWFVSEATSFESISRASRKLRASGIIQASPEVAQARKELAEMHRQYWRGR